MSEKGKKNKKKTGLGLAIWILLFLIILIVFLVKQEEIKENFDKSGATALIEKKIGKDIFDDKKTDAKDGETKDTVIELNLKKNEPTKKSEKKKAEEHKKTEKVQEKTVQTAKTEEKKPESALKPVEKTESKQKTAEESEPKVTKTEIQQTAQGQKEKTAEQTSVQTTKTSVQPVETVKTEAKPAPQPALTTNTMKAKLCFVAIDSDGPVIRKEVTRTVSKDSPLLETIKALLKGPSANEANTGCRSYIPPESQILGVSVKDGVAYLNFNEEFQFNPNGPDAANIQLMQIVYTATTFPTVKSVQFLIEGKNLQYLTEGVWIGSPLGRNRF